MSQSTVSAPVRNAFPSPYEQEAPAGAEGSLVDTGAGGSAGAT